MTRLVDSSSHVRSLSFDVNNARVLDLLGEPPCTLTGRDGAITVMEWNCGCSACVIDQSDDGAVQWCSSHRDALSYVE